MVGFPGGSHFQRRHAKIFFSGKQQCAAAADVVFHLLIGGPAEKLHRRSRHWLQNFPVWSVSNDQQLFLTLRASLHGQVNSLIRHQSRQNEVIGSALITGMKSFRYRLAGESLPPNAHILAVSAPLQFLSLRRSGRAGEKLLRPIA